MRWASSRRAYASIASDLSMPVVAWALGALMFTGLIMISMFATKHLNRIFAVFSVVAVSAFVVNTIVLEFSNTCPSSPSSPRTATA